MALFESGLTSKGLFWIIKVYLSDGRRSYHGFGKENPGVEFKCVTVGDAGDEITYRSFDGLIFFFAE